MTRDYCKANREKRKLFAGQKEFLKSMRFGIWLSLTTCFMLFLFAPLEMYINNTGEFWYDMSVLIPYCLILFSASFLVSFLFFAFAVLCSGRLYDFFLGIYFIIFIGCYVQGNILVGGLPPLDGTQVDWSLYRTEQIKSAVIWIVIAILVAVAVCVLRTGKFRALVQWTAVFMLLILGSTLAVLLFVGGKHKNYLICTKDNQFEMSTDSNFIILLLDAIDEGAFWEVWQQHPEYADVMKDFTFYDNVLSGYPCTDCSQIQILSGEWYENQEPYEDFKQRVYAESPFFEELESRGYELSIYDAELQLREDLLGGKFKNMIHAGSVLTQRGLFLKRQVKLVGTKYAPYVLKPYCWFDAHKFWNQRVIDTDNELFFWENTQLYADSMADDVTYADTDQFKYFHLEGAHVPFLYNADVQVTSGADYYSCIEASMTVVMTYLEKLRSAGVYDNSVILVMSDHGMPTDSNVCQGWQHPVLFVKGKQERHALQISGAPIAYEDLVGAYEKLLDGKRSDEIFEYQEGDLRTRRYLFYYSGHMEYMEEYTQSGYAGDENTLIPTGRTYEYKGL